MDDHCHDLFTGACCRLHGLIFPLVHDIATRKVAVIGLSRRLFLYLLVSHLMVAAAVINLSIPLYAKLVVTALIFFSLLYFIARDVLQRLAESWTHISLDSDAATVTTHDGRSFSGRVESETVVCPHFIVLHIKRDGYRLALFRVIFPDAIGREAFRELCVCLKYS